MTTEAMQFAGAMEAYGPSLARLSWMYAHRRHEQEDLLQEIAVALWNALGAFRGECSERTFIFRIAHNTGLKYACKRCLPLGDNEQEMTDSALRPDEALAHAQTASRLHKAAARLALVHRQVIMLALEGLSYQDIADVLGISPDNVGVRLCRARTELRELLRGEQ